MLGELSAEETTVVCDLEAGLGTVLRMEAGQADAVLVVCEPTTKAIEAARRIAETASPLAEVIVIANRVREEDDAARVRAAIPGHAVVVVPEDRAIAGADRDGLAPLDAAPESAAVRAIARLAERLAA